MTDLKKNCGICCETINKFKHREVVCSACQFACCKQCVKTFLLSRQQDPSCMNCKKAWDKEFLYSHLEKSFVHDQFKKHREYILFDREQSMLPATQPYVEKKRLIKQKEGEILNQKTEEKKLEDEIELKEAEIEKKREEMEAALHLAIKDLDQDIVKKRQKIQDIGHDIQMAKIEVAVLKNKSEKEERRVFVKKCPGANCLGSLSTRWKCGLCDIYVCSECHEVKGLTDDKNHVCKPEHVANVQLIASETKACPKCSVRIYRSQGCDQMFCTMCHTLFNWRTGKTTTAAVHNPHHAEFLESLRKKGKVVPVVSLECGTHPTEADILYHLGKCSIHKSICSVVRCYTHMNDNEIMRRYPSAPSLTDNLELRIKLLENEITKDEFKVKLQRHEKRFEKKRAIRQVIDMFITTAVDITHKIIKTDRYNSNVLSELMGELEALRIYVNNNLESIGKMFGGTYPAIKSDWIYVDSIGADTKRKRKIEEELESSKKFKANE